MDELDLMIPEVTIEECAEVTQAITKYLRFGPEKDGYDNKAALEKEMGQLMFMMHELELHWGLDAAVITESYKQKSKALIFYAAKAVRNQPEPKAK